MRRAAAMVSMGALVAAVVPASARASVAFGVRTITVAAPGARAVVQRAPFGLSFEDARGRPVLREVRAVAGATPRVEAAFDDPEPFGLETVREPAVYAPLSFLVGSERRAQWTGSYFAGNLLFARRRGTVHAAVRVLRARRAGAGVRLTVATDDAGRTLVVRVGPGARPGTIDVAVTPSSPTGIVDLGDAFATSAGEAFHGFGGRHDGLDQRGHKLTGWVEQENFGGPTTTQSTALLPGLIRHGTAFAPASLPVPGRHGLPGGVAHYLFSGGPGSAYYVNNQFVSDRGYGFLLSDDELSRWRMAYGRPDAWSVHVDGGAGLHYTVAVGAARKAMATLTSITGRHLLPPAWAQGPTVWRAVQIDGSETAASYRAKVEDDLATIARLRPPLTAYAFEGYELLGRQETRAIIVRLRALGLRAILYQRSYVAADALLTQRPQDVREAIDRGYVARTAAGRPFFARANGGAPQAVLDFTNAAAVRWWKARIAAMLDLGADGFMQDFGEQTQDGMHFADGETGRTMHNRYPVLYQRVTRQAIDAYERAHPQRGRIWMFTRAGFTGSARYEAGTFPGDETTDFGPATGLASLAPDMLNRAVGGAYGFTTDIGGYADQVTGATTPELFVRWSDWSALTPFFRVHNSSFHGTRMPWSLGPAVYARWQADAALHRRALPYLRRLWRQARRTGVPVTQPLWLAAPHDRRAAHQQQEWLLGRDVLVAPVVRQGARGRSVYLPAGCWVARSGPAAGRRLRGARAITAVAPPGVLPYFFRCGARPF